MDQENENKPQDSGQTLPSSHQGMTLEGAQSVRKPLASNWWSIILGELVHFIGLFLLHSKNAEGVRTTEVFFDQMLRQLDLLSRMPGNDGAILIRRTHCKAPGSLLDKDYTAFCGELMINTSDASDSIKQAAHLKSALNQAFQSFSEQNIHSLYIQIPGTSPRRMDQLRLAMNILARFRSSVGDVSSIRFRCYGRALTFPIIDDAMGNPDPNLTLMAAVNGLSPVNARELIKQAAAFHQLNTTGGQKDRSPEIVNSYNQIFSVRSLRSQIAKPPIEVNNLPWLEIGLSCPEKTTCGPGLVPRDNQVSKPSKAEAGDPEQDRIESPEPSELVTSAEQCSKLIAPYIDPDDEKHRDSINALTADDYARLDPKVIGERLVQVTRLLFALDKSCQDPTVIDRIVDLFLRQLKLVQENVLSNVIAKRRSLKIIVDGRTLVVGMVHPRLFDIITLVTEHVVAAKRMRIIRDIAFNFDPCNITALADGFGITDSDAHHILRILDGCFNLQGSFIRPTFEGRIGVMAQYENVIFEILWSILRVTPRRQDRLNFLNSLQLLMARLRNPKRATQFLLADICQTPSKVEFTDRNAFSLANILLHQENKELYVDINRTPEDVLNLRRRINKEVRQYAFWRLDVDNVRVINKLRTIHQLLQEGLNMPGGERRPFEIPFLLALEREALIFLALTGGHTARSYLRELIDQYGTPDASLYRQTGEPRYLSELMAQLQIVIRSLGCAGTSVDVDLLGSVIKKEDGFLRLASHPAHTLRVRQSLKWVESAVKMIHARV